MEEKKDYQDAYEKEHYKAVYLANRVAELEDQVDDLQFKLNRIKNNPIWKASGPARKCMHFVIRQKDRLKNCGSLSGVIARCAINPGKEGDDPLRPRASRPRGKTEAGGGCL
ncbi:MAG: hypothetical protein ACLURV_00435 [Gallintestinimicrobium sp.]